MKRRELRISGSCEHDAQELQAALSFALTAMDILEPLQQEEPDFDCIYQLLPEGVYCLGFTGKDQTSEVWKKYPFKFDISLIAGIAREWINNKNETAGYYPNTCDKGFLIRSESQEDRSVYNESIQQHGFLLLTVEPLLIKKDADDSGKGGVQNGTE